eukprot:6480103-Amphidinium_carterae.1
MYAAESSSIRIVVPRVRSVTFHEEIHVQSDQEERTHASHDEAVTEVIPPTVTATTGTLEREPIDISVSDDDLHRPLLTLLTSVRQQYVMADNGVEHNHTQATLHRWHRDNHMPHGPDEPAQQMTMRVNSAGNGTDLQWTSPVTIMHSSVTMPVENEAR